MTSQIDKTTNKLWKEKEAITSNVNQVKSIKRLKSPKKAQECKKSTNDIKIEDVFLNSEYFKYHSGNISSLSFCSGDNGENQWTVESKFEIPYRNSKKPTFTNDTIKSDTAVLEKEKESKGLREKTKTESCCLTTGKPGEKTNKFLEGILSDNGRIDRDLITLITEQMFLAERELQITRTHLIETISKLNERDLEILQLHEKIQNLQANKKKETKKEKEKETEIVTKKSEDYQRLIVASEKLKKQVKDMEEFLNDYGLVWVGDKNDNQKPDFDKIIKSFQRLNAVASEPKIIQTTIGAKFEIPREIPVVLYSNGLLLRNTDFRAFGSNSTALFLQDLEDGYFPSELQTEFPEGVPFEVTDKRNEIYTANGKTPVFQGLGNRLGSTNEGKPSSMVFLEPLKKIRRHELNVVDTTKRIHKKKSRNVFLQDEKTLIESHMNAISERLDNLWEKEAETSRGQLLNVKVRFGKDRTQSFVLQVPENDKMYAFHAELQKKLCEKYHDECLVTEETNGKSLDFEIHVYGKNPFRLSDHFQRLPAECGIVNNCVINVSEI